MSSCMSDPCLVPGVGLHPGVEQQQAEIPLVLLRLRECQLLRTFVMYRLHAHLFKRGCLSGSSPDFKPLFGATPALLE